MDLPAASSPNDSATYGLKVNNLHSGRLLWFKVEDELFGVGRDEFAAISDVFAGMYLLPSNEGVDGRDESHPITLEGYLKADFSSLLKVMYPTSRSLIYGNELKLDLDTDEWMGVLKLSTIWNMSSIRQYAISRISQIEPSIPDIEKIRLARTHRVGRWLEEGVNGLIASSTVTLSQLEPLGWKTAAIICHIRESSSNKARTGAAFSATGPHRFRLDSIRCGYCKTTASLVEQHPQCNNCRLAFHKASILTCQNIVGGSVDTDDTWIHASHIQCLDCLVSPFGGSSFSCTSGCGSFHMNSAQKIRVTVEPVIPELNSHPLVEEYFGEEIKEYKLHDAQGL